MVLCHLACLPSRGVEIALLSQLVHKSENTVKTLLDECASLGSVIVRGTKVQFVHDKPHTAALALIDPQEKPRLFAKIARDLEGSSTDYSFLRADLYIQAREANPDLIEPLEVVIACGSCLPLFHEHHPLTSVRTQRFEQLGRRLPALHWIWRLRIWMKLQSSGHSAHQKPGRETRNLLWTY